MSEPNVSPTPVRVNDITTGQTPGKMTFPEAIKQVIRNVRAKLPDPANVT